MKHNSASSGENHSTLPSIAIRVVALVVLAVTLITLYLKAVPLVIDFGRDTLRFPPANLEDIRQLLDVFEKNSNEKWIQVFTLYSVGYLLKQAFAIPGSGLMNILAGAMYGQLMGTVLVSLLASAGSTLCYLISKVFGRRLVYRLFNDRLQSLKKKLPKSGGTNGGSLWSFMVGLRLFPFFPQWFVNIAAPHLDIPVVTFFTATLLGLGPYNFITCGAGTILHEISSLSDVMNLNTLLKFFAIAVMIIGMSIYRKQYPPTSSSHRE